MVAVERPVISEQFSSPQVLEARLRGANQEQELKTWQEALAALPVGGSAQEASIAASTNLSLIY